jgi:CheY-like chemotaxis protein/two-component sensor histidine kinase
MEEAQAHREQLLNAERFARGEAERASKLKDEFLATLSHELRTPLNAIVGWAHILRQSPNGPAVARAVETIERNARAQAKLIDELLDMSRITAGKMGLMMARAPLGEIATAAVDALRPSAASKDIALSIDLAEAPDVWVLCDPARLQQVMTNLLTNGIKFTPAGGRVEARIASSQHEAHFIVRDTGEGIPPEFLPAVFERFRQADGSSTRRHGGLGLGLSIARHIVEMHGGSITAHSDGIGHGAVFTVTLPRAGGALTPLPDTRQDPEMVALDGVRVLVVDDEADARELLARLLAERGCDVSMAGSAEEALAEIAERPYELLLTDIGMPGMDGYELLRRVRADGQSLPRAIAVTAFARPQDRARALAAGFDGHLAKPLNPTQLLQMVAQIVASARSAVEKPRASDPHAARGNANP